MTGILAALLAATAFDPSALLMTRPMTLEVRRDPITDQVSAFAVARGDGMRLAVGCDPERFKGIRAQLTGRVWFADEHLVTRRRVFTYRFDDAAPHRNAWTTNDRAAMLRPPSRTANFLGWIVASNRLVMRVTDIEGREIDIFFSLENAPEAVSGMLQACRADAWQAYVFNASAARD